MYGYKVYINRSPYFPLFW